MLPQIPVYPRSISVAWSRSRLEAAKISRKPTAGFGGLNRYTAPHYDDVGSTFF